MAEYVLGHHLEGEGKRLALMSQLLDPMHRRHIESLNIEPGARTLEVGCGNGSISAPFMLVRLATDQTHLPSRGAHFRVDKRSELKARCLYRHLSIL